MTVCRYMFLVSLGFLRACSRTYFRAYGSYLSGQTLPCSQDRFCVAYPLSNGPSFSHISKWHPVDAAEFLLSITNESIRFTSWKQILRFCDHKLVRGFLFDPIYHKSYSVFHVKALASQRQVLDQFIYVFLPQVNPMSYSIGILDVSQNSHFNTNIPSNTCCRSWIRFLGNTCSNYRR